MIHITVKDIGIDKVKRRLRHIHKLRPCTTANEMVTILLHCVYQSTRNSSKTTRNAANLVATSLKANFLEFDVDAIVKSYEELVSDQLGRKLNWIEDDIQKALDRKVFLKSGGDLVFDQTEAMTMGQRIAVMKDGVVQQIDSPNNLYQQPANVFVGGFIGTPAMNFLDAAVENGTATGSGFSLTLDTARRDAAATRERLHVGIRPEHLHLAGNKADGQSLTGEVEVVEPLGALTMIQVRVGDTKVTAQIEPHQQVAMGDAVALTCAADKLYLFDAESEDTLMGIDSGVADQPAA